MTKKRILLIDDEQDLCLVMKLNLERTGAYEVLTAATGEEGLDLARRAPIDLVITDFKLPGMDGESVLDALKAIRPQAPVLLCSIYHDDATRVTPALHRKADGILVKPINREQLTRTIEAVLARSRDGSGDAHA